MTISNGSTALKTDLDAMISTALALVQADNAQVPGAYEIHLTFPGCISSTSSYKRKSTFPCPFDCYVETFAVTAAEQTAASTVKAAITGDGTLVDSLADSASLGDEGKLVFWPTKVSGTAGANTTKLARPLFDGTRTKAGLNFATTSQAHRVFLKGSTITVSVMTSSIVGASKIDVAIVLREFLARD
jgi:hypothetical protein